MESDRGFLVDSLLVAVEIAVSVNFGETAGSLGPLLPMRMACPADSLDQGDFTLMLSFC